MMDHKQGIYVNDQRLCAEASTSTVSLVDKLLRSVRGSALVEVWSRGRRIRRVVYADWADGHRVEEDV